MSIEFIILIVMLAVFAGSVFWLRLPAGVALVLAAIAGALVGGYGVPVRHIVEGMFGYLDAVLIIATAMLFMKVIESTGALSTISYGLIRAFYRWPTVLMIVIMFFVMFPGMLTGLSSACILTTGALVTPALIAMGIPAVAVGVFIAIGVVFGMIAPPINIPVMIIGGGVDMPFIGFDAPLLVATVPPAILTALYFRFRYIRRIDVEVVLAKLPTPVYGRHGAKLFLPIVIVVGLMIAIRVVPHIVPDIGMPLIFLLGAAAGLGTGERWNARTVLSEAIRSALPVMAILVGVGAFVQIMTLTGVRGMIAVSALELPPSLLYAGIALMMPAFGSAYAASSVLGVPLVYLFLGKNEIIVTSALSLIAGIGDLMPPPALLCVFAAQLVGEQNHYRILRLSLPFAALSVLWGILMIIFAADVSALLPGGS